MLVPSQRPSLGSCGAGGAVAHEEAARVPSPGGTVGERSQGDTGAAGEERGREGKWVPVGQSHGAGAMPQCSPSAAPATQLRCRIPHNCNYSAAR